MGKEAVGALMRQPLPHPYRWQLADGTMFACRPAVHLTEPKHLPRSERFEKALAAIEATWTTEHRQLQRDTELTEGEIHAMLWPGEGENRHARRGAKASRRRPRHLPRYASKDPIRQMLRALRRWWPGKPRLDQMRRALAQRRQLWRLHDEGFSNRAIGRELRVWERNVRYHLDRGRGAVSRMAEIIFQLAKRVRNAGIHESSWANWFQSVSTQYAVNKQGNHQENRQYGPTVDSKFVKNQSLSA